MADQVGDDFLVGGPQAIIMIVPVFQTEEFLAVFFPAPAFLPEFRRLQGRQDDLLGPGPVHFLADDGFHLTQGTHPQG